MHPHDTRHCKEVLPYDKNAMQLLRDLDMERIPAQLIGVLTEAAQRQSWNGSITIEVPSTFFLGGGFLVFLVVFTRALTRGVIPPTPIREG